jgi:tRNA-dihydrouridine synthase 1
MEETELLREIVSKLSQNLSIPVTCKIRILPRLADTLHLCRVLVEAGCSILTVHGRTKEQLQQLTGRADWDAIRAVREVSS